MQKNKYIISAFIGLVLIVSCYWILRADAVPQITEQINKNDSTVVLDMRDLEQGNSSFNDYFEITDILPFTKDTTAMKIQTVTKMFYDDGRYFVMDSDTKTFRVFSKEGIFSHTISGFGEGLGQYLDLTDSYLDIKRKEIVIYSAASRGIFFFTYAGKYLRQIDIPFFAYNFSREGKNFLFFMNNNFNEFTGYNNVVMTDTSGKVIAKAFHKNPDVRPGISFSGYLTNNGAGSLFSLPFSDTIYRFTPEKYYPQYVIRLGECGFRNFWSLPLSSINTQTMNHCYIYSGYHESRNIFCFSYLNNINKTFIKSFYLKSKRRFVTSKNFRSGSLLTYLSETKFTRGDTLYSLLRTELFLAKKNRKEILLEVGKDSKKLASILDTLNPVKKYNPIVVAYKFR